MEIKFYNGMKNLFGSGGSLEPVFETNLFHFHGDILEKNEVKLPKINKSTPL